MRYWFRHKRPFPVHKLETDARRRLRFRDLASAWAWAPSRAPARTARRGPQVGLPAPGGSRTRRTRPGLGRQDLAPRAWYPRRVMADSRSRPLPESTAFASRAQLGGHCLGTAPGAGPRSRGLPRPRGRAGRVRLSHGPSPLRGIPAGVPARRTWPVSVIATSRWHLAHSVRSRGESPDAGGTVTAMGTRHRLHVGRTFVVTVTIVFPSREEKARGESARTFPPQVSRGRLSVNVTPPRRIAPARRRGDRRRVAAAAPSTGGAPAVRPTAILRAGSRAAIQPASTRSSCRRRVRRPNRSCPPPRTSADRR